jgi:PAS domain S-box-containing protein
MVKSPSYKELEQKIRELEHACLDRAQHIDDLAIYRDIISSTPDGIAFLDKNYRYVFVNDAYERFSGVNRDEFIGLSVSEYLGKEIFEQHIKTHFDRCLDGETINYQEWFEYSTLGRRFMDVTYYPFRDSTNTISGVIANTRDITDRKQSENEQQFTMSLLQALHEETDRRGLARRVTTLMQEWSDCEAVGIRLQDGEEFPYFETRGFPPKFVAVEDRLCAVDGEGQVVRDLNGKPVLECMCGTVIRGYDGLDLPFFTERGSFWTNSTSELLKAHKGTDLYNKLRGHCHAEGYESVALIPLQSGQQRIGLLQFNDRRKGRFDERTIRVFERLASSLALGFLQRVTAMVLRESEEKFKNLVNNQPGIVFQFKLAAGGEQRFTFVGEGCEELYGLESHKILADPNTMFDRIPQPDADAVQQAIAQSAQTLLQYDLEHRVRSTDGRMIWIRTISTPKRLANNDTVWDGITIDITKRKEVEANLLQSYEDIKIREQIAKLFLTSATEDLFNEMLDLLLARFQSDFGYIGYIDESGDLVCPSMTLEIWQECKIPEKSITFQQKCWSGIWGESLEKKRTILRNQDISTPEKHVKIDNALVVPLLVDGDLVGQIALANKLCGFSSTDQWQLESFADFIAPVLKIYLQKERVNRKLRTSVDKLEQTNIALNVMIDRRRDEKKELSRTIQGNFDRLVFPFHETIKKSNSKEEILLFLDIIKENTITSLLSLDLPASSDRLQLTPKEIQVAHLIKAGKSSKEIATSLRISLRSVFFHRNNIRKKLNIHKKKTNLRSFLASLDL